MLSIVNFENFIKNNMIKEDETIKKWSLQ